MTETERTTAAPACTSPDQTDDPLKYEEPEDYALRLQLGLRPIAYDGTRSAGGHPDQRPCPSWCWIAGQDRDDHSLEYNQLFEAVHTMGGNPSIAASRYPARPAGEGLVSTSTIEPRLEQHGQEAPVINVALRTWEGREMRYTDDHLRLSIDDAEDLIAALTYLVKTAENGLRKVPA